MLTTLVWGHGAQRFQKLRNRALAAKRCDPDRFQRGFITSCGDCLIEFLFKCVDVGHSSLRHEGQVGIVRFAARLGEHAMHLTAVMGLMIEHVRHQKPFGLAKLALR